MDAIGRYEVETLLGRGAMGVVFLARDPHLGRQVAIKTIEYPEGVPEEVARQFEERLLREAHAAATLSHPNIVTVHDVGVDPLRHFPYIVMEFVPGPSLKDLLDGRHRLSPDLALRFGDALADALVAAHNSGVIHRDIKPANILVRNTDGIVKITDFGVARLAASELTRTGALIGSPAYMSPEQIRGAAVDKRSDLFSLAVVLYEALTARRPFGGDDLPAVAYSVAHESPVPVSRQVKGVPRSLDAFFERALAKDPDDRFPDGVAFRLALREAGAAADSEGERKLPAGGRRLRGFGKRTVPARSVADSDAGETTDPDTTDPDATDPDPADTDPAAGGRREEAAGPPTEEAPDDTSPAEGEDTDGAPAAIVARQRASLLAHPMLIVIIVSFIMAVAAVPVVFAHRPARVAIDGRISAIPGSLVVRLDGRPVLERGLFTITGDAATPPAAPAPVPPPERFESWLSMAAGRHELEAEIATEGQAEPLRSTVVLDMSPGESRTVRLVVEGTCGQPTRLRLD